MPDNLQGLAFGPGLRASGSPCTFSLSGAGIVVRVDDQRPFASWSDLRLREVGFGKPGLEIAWNTRGGVWAVHILDSLAAQQILALPELATLSQAQGLRSGRRRTQARRTFGWFALGLVLASPLLLLLAFFWQVNLIADWIATRIPIEQEVRLGREVFRGMKADLKLIDSGPAYAAVTEIGTRLTAGSKYKFEFHVVNDESLNAFALPGGVVVVHTGLIATTRRPEELAGVLAHEVQHVEQRHSLEGIVKGLGLRAVFAWVTGDLTGTLASQAALELTSLKFSRDAEREADQQGFDSLVSRGIDPSGMADFFNTLQKQSAGAPAAFISTHPLSDERATALRQRLQALPARKFAPLATDSWPPRPRRQGQSDPANTTGG